MIGFSNDIVLVISARFSDKVEMYSNDTIWINKSSGLADHNPEVVFISREEKKQFALKWEKLRSASKIKYLGGMITKRRHFKGSYEPRM